MKSSPYYIGIEQPSLLRRDLLESAKFSVAILKEKQSIKELSEERYEKISELRKLLIGMTQDLADITAVLPKHSKKKVPKSAKEIERRSQSKDIEQRVKQQLPHKDAKALQTPLTDIKGVGPKRAKQLKKAGYSSAEKLAVAYPDEVEEKTGLAAGHAQNLIEFAQAILSADSAPREEPAQESQEDHLDEIDVLERKLSAIESKLNNL